MATEVDITPYIEKFEGFYAEVLADRLNALMSEYPVKKSLIIDYFDLERYDRELADLLVKQPDTLIEAAEKALIQSQEVAFKTANPDLPFEPHVRFYNLPDTGLLIQDISSRQIREMISVKGVVTKRAEVKHKVKVAVYACQMCDAKTKVPMTKHAVVPQVCDSCKRRALKLEEDESYFVDMQWAQAQELLERLHGGVTPAHIDLVMEDDLVNTVIPGDTVEITGIMRIRPQSKGKAKDESTQVYERYLDVVYVKNTQRDFEELETTKEEEALIHEFGSSPQIFDLMRNSLAPGIYGHDEVKDALVLQLFGGTPGKSMPGGASIRDDMHILLIGDPGSAKTRFLQYVCMLAPKSIYVSGKSATGAGLTAAAEKDELGDGGWTLKAGALVIASGGIAGVDEFDKIEDNERAAMHEVMESQRISVAKAGIVATFKAKTAILAAANPKFGRFDPKELPGKQFDIPPTILSRFDLIFPIIDVLDEEKDSKLASHLLNIHKNSAESGKEGEQTEQEKTDKPGLPDGLLRKYVSYARLNVRPILTQEAIDKIKNYYVSLRKQGEGGAVPITPRYIEGLVRLSEAAAKVRLSQKVESSDADRAIKLMDYMLDKVSRDRETGKLDIDILATGRPKSQVDKLQEILGIARKMQDQLGAVEIVRLISQATERGIDEVTARRLVEDLIYKGELYKVKPGFVKLVEQSG